MVTLNAAYMNEFLRPLILKNVASENELRVLTENTIDFLRMNSTPSSALQTDIKILRCIGQKTGLLASPWPPGPATNSSFSSNHNTDVNTSGR